MHTSAKTLDYLTTKLMAAEDQINVLENEVKSQKATIREQENIIFNLQDKIKACKHLEEKEDNDVSVCITEP